MAHFITQSEADFLFGMDKIPEDDLEYDFPTSGKKITVKFTSSDKREKFLFDITRGSIKISKITYQNRARKAFILRRLDIDGPSHINPNVETVPLPFLKPYNGKELSTPHLHYYVEGFEEKWAVPANDVLNTTNIDMYDLMEEFFKYCNVKQLPKINSILLI
jgi:hypothetical protein